MSDSGASSSAKKWTVAFAAGGLLVGAGTAYYLYTRRDAASDGAPSPSPSKPPRPPSGRAAPTTSSAAPKLCSRCNNPCRNPALRCSRCKAVYYCGGPCQKAAWPQHKIDCQNMQRGSRNAPPPAPPPAITTPPPAAATPSDPSAPTTPTSTTPPAPSNGHAPEIQPDQADKPTPAAEAPAPATEEAIETPASGPAVAPPPSEVEEIPAAAETYQPKEFATTVLPAYLGQMAAQKEEPMERLFEEAVMAFIQRDYAAALKGLQAALALAEVHPTQHLTFRADIHKWLGHAEQNLGNEAGSREAFERGAELGREAGCCKVQATCLAGLANMHRAHGRLEECVAQFQVALKVAEEGGDEDTEAGVLCALGAVLVGGNPERAVELLLRAVAIREKQAGEKLEADDQNGLATAVMERAAAAVNLAQALVQVQRWEDAEAAYLSALEVMEMIEDVPKVTRVLACLANLADLQIRGVDGALRACAYRQKLNAFLKEHVPGHQAPTTCQVCGRKVMALVPSEEAGAADRAPKVVLECMHVVHQACWEKWRVGEGRGAAEGEETCPQCKEVVAMA